MLKMKKDLTGMKFGLKMMCRELGKGDFLAFSYNGKNREGTVVKRFDDALCLETVDGPRSFTYSKIRPTLDTVLDSGEASIINWSSVIA